MLVLLCFTHGGTEAQRVRYLDNVTQLMSRGVGIQTHTAHTGVFNLGL